MRKNSVVYAAVFAAIFSSPASAVDLERLVPGDELSYWAELRASGNSAYCSQHTLCIEDEIQWKSVCDKSVGVSSLSISKRAREADYVEAALLEGGVLESVQVSWERSNGGYQACYVFAVVSGMVNGTSHRRTVQGIAREFVVSESRNFIVSYWGF